MLYKEAIEPGTLELLRELQKSEILNEFILAGGTALAMQLGHRKSIDLDLFSQNDIEVNSILEYLEERFGFELDFSAKNTLKGSIQKVKIDLITHKYPFVKEPVHLEGIRVFPVEDIAAMKLNAIAGDGTRSKDFIDVYFLLKQFAVKELLAFYGAKYNKRNLIHIVKSLNYFEDIDTHDWPEMIKEKDLTLSEVKQSIKKQILSYSKKYLIN
jgi:predicted nucleotidyltransferase component of viral defense system